MRTAVIGLGRMGRRHIAAARASGGTVVGLCDSSRAALDLAGGECDVPRFSDAREMLDRISPDCVIIATTAPSHSELTCLAAESGVKMVLCEKPMATSLAECDQMIRVCAERGTRLAVNHQMRFMPHFTMPKSIGETAEFGGISAVTVIAGNFGIAMNGTHRAELLRFITGEHCRFVSAWFSPDRLPNPRGVQFEDRAGCMRLVTGSGKRMYVDASADQGHGIQVVYSGRNGQITVDELAGTISLSLREEHHLSEPTTRYALPARRTTHAIPTVDPIEGSAAVLRALVAGENYPTGEEARQALAAVVAAYISDERGGATVDLLEDVLPRDRKFPWA